MLQKIRAAIHKSLIAFSALTVPFDENVQ